MASRLPNLSGLSNHSPPINVLHIEQLLEHTDVIHAVMDAPNISEDEIIRRWKGLFTLAKCSRRLKQCMSKSVVCVILERSIGHREINTVDWMRPGYETKSLLYTSSTPLYSKDRVSASRDLLKRLCATYMRQCTDYSYYDAIFDLRQEMLPVLNKAGAGGGDPWIADGDFPFRVLVMHERGIQELSLQRPFAQPIDPTQHEAQIHDIDSFSDELKRWQRIWREQWAKLLNTLNAPSSQPMPHWFAQTTCTCPLVFFEGEVGQTRVVVTGTITISRTVCEQFEWDVVQEKLRENLPELNSLGNSDDPDDLSTPLRSRFSLEWPLFSYEVEQLVITGIQQVPLNAHVQMVDQSDIDTYSINVSEYDPEHDFGYEANRGYALSNQ